ncbi:MULTISPECIES: ABC transporter permease [Caballeronia]|uniref:ABC transporter permease n=1 Tax=Caballeronia zhejiangensis TaxID=871203 RepID=A0A656QTF9_9BURK|nr:MULTISPECIES: ABC transporter permease [Caballeronia]EKS69958.1 inner-membrane translocator [Burkholderia sp. SJ98]KDR32317.1 ABC transporter permease [Caballeronia zhejiangensis]MDR5767552.1 ABC transporter permease [Caballeronia sp. LZ028]MDR5791636.1 ABC transporter permease [Caballeronia sp. LP003]
MKQTKEPSRLSPASATTRAAHYVPWLVALTLPLVVDATTSGNLAYCLLWAFGAVGLAAMWGYGGILSFGQTAFFGLAGYSYGIFTLNYGDAWFDSWLGLGAGLVVSIVAAALIGYMIFYGRIKGVFIGIVTLSVTLVLETFMSQTAGPQWAIGEARLNGYNGMGGMPPLTVPWPGGPLTLENASFYYLVLILLIVVYAAMRKLLDGTFGLTLIAIRENPQRAEMLGVDIRRHQLLVFVLGCALGGLSGALYTIWGSYITPSTMGLTSAAMPVIWVATSGRKSIGGTILGTALLVWLSQNLAVYGSQYALILLGAILLIVVLAAPEGLLPFVARHLRRMQGRAGQDAPRGGACLKREEGKS